MIFADGSAWATPAAAAFSSLASIGQTLSRSHCRSVVKPTPGGTAMR